MNKHLSSCLLLYDFNKLSTNIVNFFIKLKRKNRRKITQKRNIEAETEATTSEVLFKFSVKIKMKTKEYLNKKKHYKL